MPEKATRQRAERARRSGKSASTQAGEFVREEIHHIREGKHGAKNAKQAIAIGLSKAREAGVPVKEKGKSKSARPARKSAAKPKSTKSSPRRAQAAKRALKRAPRRAASHTALSRQAHGAARTRTKASRSAAARKAARTRARAAR
jgi:uncharacterized protein DUF6496